MRFRRNDDLRLVLFPLLHGVHRRAKVRLFRREPPRGQALEDEAAVGVVEAARLGPELGKAAVGKLAIRGLERALCNFVEGGSAIGGSGFVHAADFTGLLAEN